MRDLTYGAMAAKHFVVAHHLRNKAQFEKAHEDAQAAANWSPNSAPCLRWPEAAAPRNDGSDLKGGSATVEEASVALSDKEREQLRQAMKAFDCCQQWSLCEVTAPKV